MGTTPCSCKEKPASDVSDDVMHPATDEATYEADDIDLKASKQKEETDIKTQRKEETAKGLSDFQLRDDVRASESSTAEPETESESGSESSQLGDHVGDHVCPVLGASAVGYFEGNDKITKLLDASGEDLGRTFSLDATSVTATKECSSGGFACAVSDPTATDCPLVFVSRGFIDLTGYSSDFATGRSCRFLQPTSKLLNDAVNLEERKIMREFCSFIQPPGTTVINLLLNQQFTGERFWNLLRMQYVVVDGDCYIFAVQTNLDAYMPKTLKKAVHSPAHNKKIVNALAPFLEALSKLRKELRTMVDMPMMELKGYFTASMNYLQMLPILSQAAARLEKPIAALADTAEADAEVALKPGQVVELQEAVRYPTLALAKGQQGKMVSKDAFGNVVIAWDNTSLGNKSILKRDLKNVKVIAQGGGGAGGHHPSWQKFYDMLVCPDGSDKAEGVAGSHSKEARDEIAHKLITNHANVINDICNPSKDKNIVGKRLTQTNLTRVEEAGKPHVDQMLREVARRLLGRRPGLSDYAERPDTKDSAKCAAWRTCAIYLAGRVQSKPEQKQGRKPDMSEAAAAVFLAVLQEVASLACANAEGIKKLSRAMADAQTSLIWQKFYDMLACPDGSDTAEGVAGSHSKEAREEIAHKLVSNHANVINDICNPSKVRNIVGKRLTQTTLTRVEEDSKPHVDQMLREVTRRLLGRRPGLSDYAEQPDTKDSAKCAAWRTCAIYLAGRVQSKPEQKQGRKPDMSEAAAAVFLAVLQEVASLACANAEGIKQLSRAMSDGQASLSKK